MIPSPAGSISESTELIVTRTIDASASRVYAAWTQPDLIRQWWSPRSEMKCLLCEVDVRVGGRYRIGMGTAAPEHTATGEYLEVTPNRRLVMTWSWEEPDSAKDTIVAVDFKAVGDKTELTIRHSRLPSQKSADAHRGGWTGLIDQFVTFLKSHASKEKP